MVSIESPVKDMLGDASSLMLHEGKSKEGSLLYPAMPFASYTRMTRADSDAMYAYLMSVPPVHQPNRPHALRFPFNKRELLLGWRTLYFRQGEYKPDPTQSVELLQDRANLLAIMKDGKFHKAPGSAR